MVKDFKLNPEDFPELQTIVTRNTSNFFISRSFRAPGHPDYLPLYKIEDLFEGNIRMLVDLVRQLLKKGMLNQAVGVY